jgi:hypothetical protein
MKAKRTPAIALWLLRTFGCSPDTEIVIGDLVERHEAGESRFWFWRQAITALVRGFRDDALSQKALMIRTLFMAWAAFLTFRLMIIAPNILHAWTLDASTLEKVTESGWVIGFAAPTFWPMSYPVIFFIYSVLSVAITGRIAARAGGAHRKTAVFTYACSFVVFLLLDWWPLFLIPGVVPWYTLTMVTFNVALILACGLVTRSAPAPARE